MIYLENNTNVQDVFIPRQDTINVSQTGMDLSEYFTSGQTIEVINQSLEGYATEQYVDDAVSGITVDLTDYWTSGQTQSAITSATTDMATQTWVEEQGYLKEHQSLSAYSTTQEVEDMIESAKTEIEAEIPDVSGFATEEWVEEQGYLTEHQSLSAYSTTQQVEDMIASAKTDIESEIPDVRDFVTSGDVQTQIEDSISGIPTEFKTINNQSIIGEGNIEIEGGSGTTYSAGANIDITNDVISVTGITVPDVSNFVTSGDVQTQIDNSLDGFATEEWVEEQGYLTEHQSLSAYSTTQEVEGMIASAKTEVESEIPDVSGFVTSGQVKSQIESYDYATQSQIPDVSNFVTSGDVENQIDDAMAVETARTESTYLKEHQSLSAYSTTQQVEGMIASAKTEVEAEIPDVSEFVTSGDVQTQFDDIWDYAEALQETVDNIPTYSAGTNIDITNGTISVTGITVPDVSNFVTSGDVQTQIDDSISGIPTEFKTINNQSIIGQGNIEIEGGGDNIVELTKAEYEALGTGYTEDTTYVITDADTVDLNDYALQSAVTSAITEVTNSLATKATKASISNHNTRQFPTWNSEGIITGTTGNTQYEVGYSINGSNRTILSNSNSNLAGIYAPTSAGTKDQVLLSNGSGAPVWSSYKMQFISQSAYDALATKDATTIYFIISED